MILKSTSCFAVIHTFRVLADYLVAHLCRWIRTNSDQDLYYPCEILSLYADDNSSFENMIPLTSKMVTYSSCPKGRP